ncbi:MAG: hypothetical protein FJ102_00365 [Deltaproteobacteria bacterium]|nr:hypothetical protein [Deltaproteobacteria bacterium]
MIVALALAAGGSYHDDKVAVALGEVAGGEKASLPAHHHQRTGIRHCSPTEPRPEGLNAQREAVSPASLAVT